MRAVFVAAVACGTLGACQGLDPAGEAETEAEVMGGTAAPPNKWPDVAAVMFDGEQGCTGTLIAPTVVLTAGHCNDPSLTTVLVGTHSLALPGSGQTIQVKSRFEYFGSQSTYDLTVLVLKVPSTKTPRAIASGWAKLDIANGASVSIVGYGAIERTANQYVNELQEATTTITDAGCTDKPGCNSGAKPNGELGAGGMGIDTCPGDSGGPLYTITPYGTFLAGVTSRAYNDAQFPCTDGGIYVRPDKVIDWIEQVAEVPVGRGPTPAAPAITAVRGTVGETQIVPNDPIGTAHTYAIRQAPAHGMATVDATGKVSVCTKPEAAVSDAVVVSVTDAAAPARSLDVRIPITVTDGTPGTCAGVTPPPDDPPPDDPPPAEDDDDGGCATGGAGGSLPLVLALGALLVSRRRRR